MFRKASVATQLVLASAFSTPQVALAANLDMYWEEAGINGGTASQICANAEEYLKGKGFSARRSPQTEPIRMTASGTETSVFVQCGQDGSVARILITVAGKDVAAAEKLASDLRTEAGRRPSDATK